MTGVLYEAFQNIFDRFCIPGRASLPQIWCFEQLYGSGVAAESIGPAALSTKVNPALIGGSLTMN